MKKDNAKVLMVIPTLGERLDLLQETLESIKQQDPGLLDLVVVCPKDNTAVRDLAKKYGATLVDDPKNPRGISAAVNAGIAAAKPHHTYLAWMGDDDLLQPNTMAASVARMEAHPKAAASFGYCEYIDSKGRKIFTSKAGRLAPHIMSWGPHLIPLPGALFRMSELNKIGLFDTSLKFAMDLDMFLRLRKQGPFINMQRVVGSFRWHPDSTTVANRKASTDEAELVKRRYLSPGAKKVAFVWEQPIRLAAHVAAKRVTGKALNMDKGSANYSK